MFKEEVLANNLKKYRKKKKYTQCLLAEKLFVSEQAVSKWECMKGIPSLSKLCDIAEILEVSVDKLLFENETDKRVLLGIDGGGTKTEFVLFYEDGKIINHTILEGCNPNTCGLEKTYDTLKKGINLVMKEPLSISAVFAGIAGCGASENGLNVKNFLVGLFPNINIVCSSDVLNVIASANISNKSIGVICGTGSVVYANVEEDMNRAGGWGYLLGDACSGFSIGRDALRAALAEEDGTGEKTLITQLAEKKFGGIIKDGLNEIYLEDKSYIASFAPLIFEAYEKGDKVASEILKRNSSELAGLINHMANKNDCDDTVVLSGSIFKNTRIYDDFMRSFLDEKLNIVIPDLPPIYGACVQCMRMINSESDKFKKVFAKEYKKLKRE